MKKGLNKEVHNKRMIIESLSFAIVAWILFCNLTLTAEACTLESDNNHIEFNTDGIELVVNWDDVDNASYYSLSYATHTSSDVPAVGWSMESNSLFSTNISLDIADQCFSNKRVSVRIYAYTNDDELINGTYCYEGTAAFEHEFTILYWDDGEPVIGGCTHCGKQAPVLRMAGWVLTVAGEIAILRGMYDGAYGRLSVEGNCISRVKAWMNSTFGHDDISLCCIETDNMQTGFEGCSWSWTTLNDSLGIVWPCVCCYNPCAWYYCNHFYYLSDDFVPLKCPYCYS